MIVEGFYKLLAMIDYLVYKLAATMVSVNIDIAGKEIFRAEQIDDIVQRVYIVIGVVMLFKIIISAIQYMINPDSFDDKEKGMAGILKKTVLSILLIVISPAIFNFMVAIQSTVIKTIPKLVFGTEAQANSLDDGEKMSYIVLSSFVKVNDGNENSSQIHDIDSFSEHIAEGCGGGIIGDAKNCKYDYMILISTLCGGFLCYVLLSMTLDVAIRTIKFSLIRLLAPIPISSYVFSKDKLNKFVKTTLTVYFDLFIRLALIYFIIFAVREVIDSKLLENIAGDDNWFRNAIVNIAIIGGLFMFAKNAPKFITELLGLPDVGAGDMKDMFKPAWQRYGGLAGAAINPTRNAVSNWRQAWKNNADIVDSRGGKIRRAMQNARRVGNASRHAAGGAFRGAVDAFAGAAAGDDWAKMNERHRKATSASAKKSAEGYMKRTSNDVRQEVRDQRKQIEKEFAEQGIDINSFTRNARSKAQTAVRQRLSGLQAKRDYLNQKIAQGGTNAEMSMWKDELNKTSAAIQTLSSKDGFDKAVNAEMQSSIDTMISGVTAKKIDSINNKINSNSERMAIIQTELSDSTLSDNERRKKNAEYVQLMQENEQLETQITPAAIAQTTKTLTEEFGQHAKIKEEKLETADISGKTIVRGKVDEFFGGEGFTGKGYLDTADLLKNNRSNLYTGEAMTKMRQNADILVDENNNPAAFDIKFTIPSAGKVKYTYAQMADIKRRVDNGSLTDPAELEKLGFANSAMVQSAFEDMEKQAAEKYVTANMAAADPSIHSDVKLKGNAAPNLTIVEGIKRMKASLAGANIPKEEKDRLLAELSSNPGKFFKGASDLQERMRTRGSRISAYNSGKKES